MKPVRRQSSRLVIFLLGYGEDPRDVLAPIVPIDHNCEGLVERKNRIYESLFPFVVAFVQP